MAVFVNNLFAWAMCILFSLCIIAVVIAAAALFVAGVGIILRKAGNLLKRKEKKA